MPDDKALSWRIYPLNESSIKDLYADWQNLTSDVIDENVFLTPWFVRASLHLTSVSAVQIITIYADDVLIGLFLVQKDKGYKKLPFRFLKSGIHPHQFLATPLVRNHYMQDFVTGLLKWLDQTAGSINFLCLTHLSGDSPIVSTLQAVSRKQKRSIFFIESYQRAAIETQNYTQKTVNDRLQRSRLKSLRRNLKKLKQQGDLKIEKFTSSEEPMQRLNEFLALENKSWKKDAGSSIILNQSETKFYQEMTQLAAEQDALSFIRMTLDNVPIAYTVDLTMGGSAYCLKCAYDPTYKSFAPGVHLEYETLLHYIDSQTVTSVDSCSSPDNSLLNELWPDKKLITRLIIERKGWLNSLFFPLIKILTYLSMKTENLRLKI